MEERFEFPEGATPISDCSGLIPLWVHPNLTAWKPSPLGLGGNAAPLFNLSFKIDLSIFCSQ